MRVDNDLNVDELVREDRVHRCVYTDPEIFEEEMCRHERRRMAMIINRQQYTSRLTKLPKTHYLDNRIYTDTELFAEERRRIFERVWNFVCLASEVAQPGDYRVVTVAGHSLLIVRGEDGQLRAFYNMCTHRAAPLVREERGSGFRAEDGELVGVRVETVGGLVFVSLSEEPGSLSEYLGEELVGRIENTLGKVELEAFHYHKAMLQTNWKLWNDNNSEIYHAFLHVLVRKTAPEAFYAGTSHLLYPNGHAFTVNAQPVEARMRYEGYGLESREGTYAFPGLHGNAGWLVNIFPDLLLLIRGTVLRIDRMVPLSPGQTLVEWRGVGIKGDTPAVRALRVRHHNQIWGPMGRNLPEDVCAVEEQWRQMSSGAGVGYSVYARESQQLENGRSLPLMDDENMRAYYRTWGQWMGRSPQAPFGEISLPAEGDTV